MNHIMRHRKYVARKLSDGFLFGIKIKIFRNFWKKNRNHRKGIAITLIRIIIRNIFDYVISRIITLGFLV